MDPEPDVLWYVAILCEYDYIKSSACGGTGRKLRSGGRNTLRVRLYQIQLGLVAFGSLRSRVAILCEYDYIKSNSILFPLHLSVVAILCEYDYIKSI